MFGWLGFPSVCHNLWHGHNDSHLHPQVLMSCLVEPVYFYYILLQYDCFFIASLSPSESMWEPFITCFFHIFPVLFSWQVANSWDVCNPPVDTLWLRGPHFRGSLLQSTFEVIIGTWVSDSPEGRPWPAQNNISNLKRNPSCTSPGVEVLSLFLKSADSVFVGKVHRMTQNDKDIFKGLFWTTATERTEE